MMREDGLFMHVQILRTQQDSLHFWFALLLGILKLTRKKCCEKKIPCRKKERSFTAYNF